METSKGLLLASLNSLTSLFKIHFFLLVFQNIFQTVDLCFNFYIKKSLSTSWSVIWKEGGRKEPVREWGLVSPPNPVLLRLHHVGLKGGYYFLVPFRIALRGRHSDPLI